MSISKYENDVFLFCFFLSFYYFFPLIFFFVFDSSLFCPYLFILFLDILCIISDQLGALNALSRLSRQSRSFGEETFEKLCNRMYPWILREDSQKIQQSGLNMLNIALSRGLRSRIFASLFESNLNGDSSLLQWYLFCTFLFYFLYPWTIKKKIFSSSLLVCLCLSSFSSSYVF